MAHLEPALFSSMPLQTSPFTTQGHDLPNHTGPKGDLEDVSRAEFSISTNCVPVPRNDLGWTHAPISSGQV